MRQKRHIAESVQSLGVVLKNFIAQYTKTKPEQRFEYLRSYSEFRYQQVISSLYKLVQSFYHKQNVSTSKKIQQTIAQITKMDHMRLIHLKPNNYSVSSCMVSPNMQGIDSGNLLHGSLAVDDMIIFQRCIQPLVNERALEPSQITLFQSMYQQDIFRKRRQTQFAGQFVSSHNSVAYNQFQTALISLNKDERSFCQAFILSTKYQINDFMECVHDDSTVSISKENDVYNLSQIQLGTKFINESASSLLLRTALICWSENSVLPDTLEKFKQFESNFKQNYFWKQIQQKDEMLKSMKIKNTIGNSAPTEEHLKELKQKIDKLVDDHTLPTEGAVSKRDQMVKALREEFAALKKKVVFDEYLNIKAQISVFRNEIEKLLIMASVKTLDSETAALAKCFTIQVPSIQYHIHPFQYFAATFYDKVDPNANMDVSNKVNIAQEFLTKVRNRSTEVETLTSGPGIVVPLKDLNEILIDFCRTSIQDQQKQFKSRAELSCIMEAHYRKSIFTKDQKIKSLERRIDNIGLNLDFIINSKLFEKGNQLIYELDASNRLLEVFRKNMHFLEQKITEKVLGEQLEKFKRKNNHVEMKDQKFNDYKDAIMNMISADFAAEQDRIKFILKQKAEQAKVIDKSTIQYKQINMYPAGNNNQTKEKDLEIQQNQGGQPNGLLTGAVVPKGFNHYPHCVCYMPDPRYPRPTLELAQLDMLSEMEARSELKQMCILVRKQRLLYRTKEMCLMSKYQTKINLLESQQNNNSLIWEQLAESDKREKVLKQELVFSQQSLALAHKQIENLTLEVRSLESEKGRLQKFKSQKVDKLRELEKRVKQIDMSELIDSDKLIAVLDKREIEVRELHTAFDTMDSKLLMTERRKDKDIAKYKQKLQSEQIKNSQMVERMEQLKLELKAFDQNDTSVTSIWKKKCLDLFEVCQTVKKENDELRKRCSELITQGISLADAIAGNSSIQSTAEQDFASNRKNTHFSTFTRGAPSQLPELTSHNQSSFMNKPTSVFVDQSRNMTPQSNLPHPVQTSQQSRNKRQNSQFQSLLSKEVGSEDVQNEILMNSARWGSKKIVEFSAEIPSTGVSSTQNNRGRSLGQIPAIQNQKKSNVGSQNVQQFTGDIRSILCNQDDLRLSDMDVRSQPNSGGKVTMRDKKNQKIFDNAIKRRNKNFGLHSVQDSLFINQNSTQHSQISGQNIITTGSNAAIQQLKDASRFRGLDLKGVSYSAMQAQPPNSAQSPKNLSERENPLSQRNVRKIPLVQKNEIDSSENLGSQGSLKVPNQRMDDEEDQVAQIMEVSKH